MENIHNFTHMQYIFVFHIYPSISIYVDGDETGESDELSFIERDWSELFRATDAFTSQVLSIFSPQQTFKRLF